MKEQFLKHSLHFITTYQKDSCDEDTKERILYGLEGLYLSFTKLFVLSIIALLLGFFKGFIITLVLFNILRYPGFGFHANNSKTCLIFSSLLILGLPFALHQFVLSFWVKAVLCGISIVCFIIYAPADTQKRPLTNPKKRKIRKICATILAIIYSSIILFTSNQTISQLFLGALLIETILILPITYKLLKAPYGNYKMV